MKGTYRVTDDQYGYEPEAYARFGDGSWIVPPVRVQHPHRIAVGAGVVLMEQTTIAVLDGRPGEPLLVLGDGLRLARFCAVVCEVGVTFGADVGSSDCATVIDTWRVPFLPAGSRPVPPPAPVVIGDGAYLGMNSLVGPGVTVGEGAYIGEGAIVLDDVPAHAVVRGNPAELVPR